MLPFIRIKECVFSSVTWILVFIAVAIAPLLPDRLMPISSQLPNAWAAFWFCIFLLISSISLQINKIWSHWHYSMWGWIGMCLLVFLNTRFTLAAHKDALIFPIMALMLAGCIHFIAINVSNNIRRSLASALAWSFYIAGFVTFLLQLYQLTDAKFMGGWVFPLSTGMQPYGNVAQRNEAAFILVLAMAGAAHCMQYRCRQWSHLLLIILLMVPMIAGISLTGSRLFLFLGGAVFASCISWVVQPVLWQQHSPRIKAWTTGLALAAITLYVLMYTFFIVALDWLPHRPVFDSVVERIGNVSNLTRIALQQQAWAMFLDKPLTGQGWGSFSAFGLQWSDRSLLPLFADHSHFLPSQILAEVGLVGFIVLTPLIYCLITALLNSELWKNYFFPQAMCILTTIYSFSEFPLWNGYFLLPFSLSLGIISSKKEYFRTAHCVSTPCTGSNPQISQNKKIDIFYFLISCIALITAFGTLISSRTYVELNALSSSVFTRDQLDNSVFEKINGIEPAFGFSAIKEMYLFVSIKTDSNDLDNKIALGERVANRFVDATILFKLGILYGINNEEDKLFRVIQDACRFYPLQCEKTLEKLKNLDDVNDHIFQRIHHNLFKWWSVNKQNPNQMLEHAQN